MEFLDQSEAGSSLTFSGPSLSERSVLLFSLFLENVANNTKWPLLKPESPHGYVNDFITISLEVGVLGKYSEKICLLFLL